MVRGLIQSVIWAAGKVRRIVASGLPGQIINKREMMQHYGFSSDPPAGCQVVMLKLGNHIIAIAEDKPGSGPDLNALNGRSALWSDATHYFIIKKDGSVLLKTDQQVTVDSANVVLGGSAALATAGVVTGECLCAFTGAPHIDKSTKVKAVK